MSRQNGPAADSSEVFRGASEAAGGGDFKKARQLYDTLRKTRAWSQDKEVQLRYAYACERTGDYSEALEAYRQLIRQYHLDTGDDEMVAQGMASLRKSMAAEHIDVASMMRFGRDADEPGLISRLFHDAPGKELDAGDLLCRTGDVAGQMWLLTEGSIDVIVPGQGTSRVTGTPTRPCLLGELPYFTHMRRAADLCAATGATVLELPYERMPQIVRDEPDLGLLLEHLFRHRLVLQVLSKHKIFKLLNDVDRRRIAMTFENAWLKPGQVLMEKGEEMPQAFMVQSGTMLLLYRNTEGKEELIGSMQVGDMFHLGGLLRGFHAPYRIVAGTPVQLLRLPRERFEPFMLQRPWLIKALIKRSRMAGERQIMHPEARDLWAADRYVDLDNPLG
ncbi:MAG TPA: cyclic nucleotide-binding domain-containing protein [Mariprofundaceae bacterium]|nr:cyclic nucleotide-binding domain-containing protein [Mariprofundaceae bacterium]